MNKSLFLILLGVGAGILLAPRKGSETWKMVLDRIDELKRESLTEGEELKDSVGSVKEAAVNAFQGIKDEALGRKRAPETDPIVDAVRATQ